MATIKDPFAILASEEKKIKVEALGGAEVTIKTSLTVGEQMQIDELMYGNSTPKGEGKFTLNPADYGKAVLQRVSFALVEPKKTVAELKEIPHGDKAINEIDASFLELKKQSEK